MIRPQDGLLLVVAFASILLGVAFPGICSFFSGMPKYAMMALLFLSFLSVRPSDLFLDLKSGLADIGLLLMLKLVVLPVIVYLAFILVLPRYAPAALLLSGISTGVVAPYVADMLEVKVSKVILVVVLGSLLVPFTLPVLVEILLGHQIAIPLSDMIQLLGLIVLIPFLTVEALRRARPRWVPVMLQVKQPVSLLLFAITNMGVFSTYADFFRNEMKTVGEACGVSFLLAALYFAAGLALSWRKPIKEKITTIIIFGIMNNVLVMVFSAEFFGPLEPTVAAAYSIPFFGFILPLRVLLTKRCPSR